MKARALDRMTDCPLCASKLLREPRVDGDAVDLLCPNCGEFCAAGSLAAVLDAAHYSLLERACVSYAVKRMNVRPMLTTDLVTSLLESTELPDASILRDNLVLHVASLVEAPGEAVPALKAVHTRAAIGARSSAAVQWAIDHALEGGLLQGQRIAPHAGPDSFQLGNATLTPAGWQRVEELMREARHSTKVFMAMKFGDPELDAFFQGHLKEAVRQTGFDLARLDEAPRAGLIDDRLRLELRTSKFVIADLSHANLGAYWEAGFAEGLGRSVIYMCRKDVFDDAAQRPHFDTNHYLTIIWDPANLAEAAERLKTVIRVTFPAEAILEDPKAGG